MENKKLDLNSIIGFVLIFGILIWIMYQNQPTEAEIAADKANQEQVQNAKIASDAAADTKAEIDPSGADSAAVEKLRGTLGSFAYSATLPSAKSDVTTIENDLLQLKVSNKGGYIVEATLKKFEKFKKNSGDLVKLIKDNNTSLNLTLQTRDNRTLETKNLYFEPTLTTVGGNQVLTMRLKAGPNEFLEYRYVLKPSDYMLDFDVRSQGLSNVLNTSKPLELQWN